ncbi:hypothetical protein [Fibrisoma limi]|nr:hypothetical protein [Fibrisoma limi]
MKGEFEPGSDKNIIQLDFSSYKVTLQGYGLKPLFLALLNHQPRFIKAIDARYAHAIGKSATVTAIRIEVNNE